MSVPARHLHDPGQHPRRASSQLARRFSFPHGEGFYKPTGRGDSVTPARGFMLVVCYGSFARNSRKNASHSGSTVSRTLDSGMLSTFP